MGKGIGSAGVLLTAGAEVYNDWNENSRNGANINKKLNDTAVDLTFAAGGLGAAMAGGAVGGSLACPVVGTVVGGIVGGLAYVVLTDGVKYKGKSVKDWAKWGLNRINGGHKKGVSPIRNTIYCR